MGERIPQMVELSPSRSLQPHEQALMRFILEHPHARPELRDQAESVRVVSECDCGCRSVGLLPDDSAPPAHYGVEESTYRTEDQSDLVASGRSAAGTHVDVILHVVWGRMVELEIYDGGLNYGICNGELPQMASLSFVAL